MSSASYITKDEEPEVIIQAVRKVARGERGLFSPKAKKQLDFIQYNNHPSDVILVSMQPREAGLHLNLLPDAVSHLKFEPGAIRFSRSQAILNRPF